MASPWKGLDLARALYVDVVKPALNTPHAACLIGEGSEVLGYDTARSVDHEWGPRLQLFVAPDAVVETRAFVDDILPNSLHGFHTHWFSLKTGKVDHHIEVDTAENWLSTNLPRLPADPDFATWLAAPQQHLVQLTAGEVFRDDLGDLTRRRQVYGWYPRDLWLWMIASQWHLIGNAEPIVGRTIESGDHRGARLITARLCRLIMEMTYLQHRRYQPYAKWFGRGFTDLPGSQSLGTALDQALDQAPAISTTGPLQKALLILAEAHNNLGVTAQVTANIADFDVGINDAVRPYPVLNTSDFIEASVAAIRDPQVVNLPRVGPIDQLTHADDLLINFTTWPNDLAAIYRQTLSPTPEVGTS